MTVQAPLIRALLIDISGTLLVGSSATPGAVQALAKLRAARIPFRFCSNTSKESSDAVHKRMRAAGLDVHRAEVWTTIGALRAVLKELGVNKPYMLLSQSALEECTDKPETEDGPNSASSSSYDAVVVGLAPALLDYEHLNTAFRILVGENGDWDVLTSRDHSDPNTKACSRPPLIALHRARYFEAADNALSLGPGPFVHALEEATQTSAMVLGKPTRSFFETVLRDLNRDLPSDRGPDSPLPRWEGVMVIGDDVHADLAEGAIELGLWRVLVKTGKYRAGDEERTGELPPDQVCASFAQFVETLLEQRVSSS